MLGTRGGPAIQGYAPSPFCSLLIYKGVSYVVDTGYGATFKLVEAGLPLPALRYIFITHHHSDHNLELGPVVYLGQRVARDDRRLRAPGRQSIAGGLLAVEPL
jgi:ribonuclease BN (tRNA processing enzyme)